jgi:thiamine pyrophosphate-dependent acetolactate synthase large subunit-like protein
MGVPGSGGSLAIGNSLNQHATFGYRDDLFNGKKLIHVNISEMEIDKAYKADAAIVADAKPAVEALHAALEPKVKERPPAKVDGRDYEARRIPHIGGDIHPGQLAQAIGRMLPPGGIVLADAGAHLAWMFTSNSRGQCGGLARWPGTSAAQSTQSSPIPTRAGRRRCGDAATISRDSG